MGKRRKINKTVTTKSTRRSGFRNGTVIRASALPAYIAGKPIFPYQFRTVATANLTTAATITSDDIRHYVGTTTAASTAFIPILDSVRIKHVRVTGVLNGTAGSGMIVHTWRGDNVPDTDTAATVSLSNPAELKLKPPPNSSAAWWYDDASANKDLFSIRKVGEDSGDIVVYLDIYLDVTFNDGAVTPVTLSTGAANTGVSYLNMASNTFFSTMTSVVHT